ncbi:MAG: succinate dehydrogenase assembly factor 2 [Gammaproteobacteria bacterium]
MQSLQQLKWRCRRGTKELDLLVRGFLDRHYANAPAAMQRAFADLLERQDPDLYDLLSGNIPPPDPDTADVIRTIHNDAAHSS